MTRTSTRPIGALAVLLAALLLAACGDAGDAPRASASPTTTATGDPLAPNPLPERQKLTVTVPIKIEAFAQVLLAEHYGEFTKENLDIDIRTMPGNEAIALLATGRADVQTGGPTTAMFNAISQGADLVWAASNYRPAPEAHSGLWLSNDLFDEDGEPDPEKIRGATIAFGGLGMAGTPPTYLVGDWLESIGLSLADVEEQKLNGADMLIAMENGSIDGGWILDPFWLELEGTETARFVVGQPAPLGGYILGPSRWDKQDAMTAFFRAMVRTTRTYLEGDYHRDPKVLADLASIIEVSPEVIERTPALVFDQDLAIDVTAARRVQEAWFDLGVLEYETLLPLRDYVDQSLVEAAIGEG